MPADQATAYHPIIFHNTVKATDVPKTKSKKCKDCDCADDGCPNVFSRIECPPSCKCSNQKFRSSVHHCNVIEKDCGVKGRGLFTLQPIKADSFVLPFTAEVVTEAEKDHRQGKYDKQKQHAYFFGTGIYTMDATKYGNKAKFTNHSCDPNMVVERWTIHGAPSNFKALAFIARRDIAAGEELTINYGEEYSTTMKCLCGAKTCAGIVGQKPKPMKVTEKKEAKKTTVVEPKPAEKKVPRKPPTNRSTPEVVEVPKLAESRVLRKRPAPEPAEGRVLRKRPAPESAQGRVLRKRPAPEPTKEVNQLPKRTRKAVQ